MLSRGIEGRSHRPTLWPWPAQIGLGMGLGRAALEAVMSARRSCTAHSARPALGLLRLILNGRNPTTSLPEGVADTGHLMILWCARAARFASPCRQGRE